MSLFKGNRGAVVLTFDDALPCQLQHAVPALDSYGLKGTFFCITGCKEYPLDVVGWRPAFVRGHECGSHSVNHFKAATLNGRDALNEAYISKGTLQHHFDVPVESFCYPFTDAPAHLQEAVADAGYKQARGGRVARRSKYFTAGQQPNYMNLPCFHVNEGTFAHEEIYTWIDAALERHAWVTLMFHAVGDEKGWDNVTIASFNELCQFLAQARDRRGLWIDTLANVADNFRRGQ